MLDHSHHYHSHITTAWQNCLGLCQMLLNRQTNMSGLKLFLVHKRQSQMSKLERQSKKTTTTILWPLYRILKSQYQLWYWYPNINRVILVHIIWNSFSLIYYSIWNSFTVSYTAKQYLELFSIQKTNKTQRRKMKRVNTTVQRVQIKIINSMRQFWHLRWMTAYVVSQTAFPGSVKPPRFSATGFPPPLLTTAAAECCHLLCCYGNHSTGHCFHLPDPADLQSIDHFHVTHTHTHTPFNGPFSRTTWVSRYQKSKTNLDFTKARDSEWQWHPDRQTHQHPTTQFLQAGCSSCRPTKSVKALKALITFMSLENNSTKNILLASS